MNMNRIMLSYFCLTVRRQVEKKADRTESSAALCCEMQRKQLLCFTIIALCLLFPCCQGID